MHATNPSCSSRLDRPLAFGANTHPPPPHFPETVVFGYYAAATPPVLRIKPGDRVEITTSMIASPQMLEEAGLPSDQIKPALRDIHIQVTDRGPGRTF